MRLGAVGGAQTVDATGLYLPAMGADSRSLPADVYDMSREGVVQAQLRSLGTFNHAGVIDLRGAAIGNTLMVTGAADPALGPGNGTFVSDRGTLWVRAGARSAGSADYTERYADMLIVDGTRVGAGGATRIHVDYDPADMGHLTKGNGIQVVEVRDKSASAPGAFVLGNRVASGAYEYALHHGGVEEDAGDGNWYLRSFVRIEPEPDAPAQPSEPDAPAQPQPDAPAQPAKEVPSYRQEVPVAMAVPALAQRLGMDVIGTYHDRAGEDHATLGLKSGNRTRSPSDGEEARAWGRIFGRSGKAGGSRNSDASRFRWFEKNGPRYDFDMSGFQVGLDVHRDLNDDGSRNVAGAYFAAARGSARVDAVLGGRTGKTSMNGYTLGAYWTHLARAGSYVDAVAQVTRYGSVRTRSVAGEEVNRDGWGAAASLEVGFAFELDATWTLEPQAQLIYQTVSLGGTRRDRYGEIRHADSDAWYGRLGARLVRNWTAADGSDRAFWVRADVWHDFGSHAQTTFSSLDGRNAVSLRTDLGGTWGQLGLGFNTQVSGRLVAFVAVDYERRLNDRRSHGVSGRVGLQYVW